MTNQPEFGRERNFVSAALPWLVALFAFAIYIQTLNHWVALNGLPLIAHATGQASTADIYFPCFSLVTYPLQWLPLRWIPIVSNLFSTMCAVLTLMLLARSVSLLPHDRTHSQRQRENDEFSLLSIRLAWIPPVLAACVCGLQLSFWENATSISVDMFDLLLLAYAIRCFLEFRISQHNSWLFRGVFVYAAGMTDSWIMIALAPALLIALVWVKGLEFFKWRFIFRLVVCGLIGLLFYLALPLMHLSEGAFWEALKMNWTAQMNAVVAVFRYAPHELQLLMVLTSLLPILVISIRWASSFGDPSQIGVSLTTLMFHLAHAFLLGACIWVAFDPKFSLRSKGLGALPLYYLGALSIGYLAGYFLLVFRTITARGRHVGSWEKLLEKISVGLICLLLVLVPAGLIYKNIPPIKFTNGPALKQYASLLVRNLPSKAVILTDDARRLSLAEAFLSESGRTENYLFLETHSLKFPAYGKRQQKRHPKTWPSEFDFNKINAKALQLGDLDLLNFIAKVSESNTVYYLHPSFGYYFEYFYMQPHGLAYELRRYPTNVAVRAPFPEAVIEENEAFWSQSGAKAIQALLPFITPPLAEGQPPLRQRFMDRLHIPFEANSLALALGKMYSHSLDYWGVEAQRAGHLEQAGIHFAQASELNPDNVVAQINLTFNKNLRSGQHDPIQIGSSLEDRFGKYRSWDQMMIDNGPFDEPSFCFALGRLFMQGNLSRAAAENFARVIELDPDNLAARFFLARLFLISKDPEKALPLVDELNARASSADNPQVNSTEILQLNLMARLINNQTAQADEITRSVLKKQPPDTNGLNALVSAYSALGRYSNALPIVDKQLEIDPANSVALVNRGFINIQLGNYERAIPPLSAVLAQDTTNYPALLNRAIAYYRSDKLPEAQQDYQTLQSIYPKAYPVYFGLGEIAYRNKDTNAAIQYYNLYLSNSPPNNPELKVVRERLGSLKPAPR